jgi:predicted deacylase
VIRGSEDGPTLALIAGCHPTEYSGIDATIKFSNEAKPDDLTGTLIMIPCVNTPGFYERTYINPIDGKNIQGLYPGKLDGTISDMMAYRLFHDIVMKVDYFLDCHGSDIHESNLWAFHYYGTDNDVEERSEAIARATGLTYISRSIYPGAMGMEAAKRGISGGLYELCSGDKLLPEESKAIYKCTLNVMRHLEMLKGEPKKIKKQPGTIEGQEQEIWTSDASVFFTKKGLYHTDVKAGDLLTEGEVVGTVTNFWGEVVETILAPATGRVSGTIHNPVANLGDTAVSVHF